VIVGCGWLCPQSFVDATQPAVTVAMDLVRWTAVITTVSVAALDLDQLNAM